MVTFPVAPDLLAESGASDARVISLENFVANPLDGMEWVDGQVVAKTGMTIKHGVVQANIAFLWKSHMLSTGQGGTVCTEAPCRTQKQVRRPDVGYITPELLAPCGEPATMPQSFPLIAEIASPTDIAQELFSKTQEYLQSGCEEAWMVFPENQWVLVITQTQHFWFTADEVVITQVVLKGFSIKVSKLLD